MKSQRIMIAHDTFHKTNKKIAPSGGWKEITA
jgi:hypothetical protein